MSSRTRIELGTSGTIDLLEDIPLSLNYAIADIREPEKRNSSFSKTITIPGSKTNNRLFNHIFEINSNSNFDPNIKTPAIVYVDDIEILRGYLRLLNINRLIGGKVEYECSIVGNVGSIFVDMGNSELSDLDFSEFDHTYNRTNQVASWTAPVGAGYVYPFIDYGKTNGNEFYVSDFYPAIYVKQYWDKIFSSYGYSYTSNFLDSDLFKRLIIPYNNTTIGLSEDQISQRLFSSTIGSSGSITLSLTPGFYSSLGTTFIPFNSETSDPYNLFNTSTYRFTCANEGSYHFDASFTMSMNNSSNSFTGWAHIMRYRAGTYISMGNVPVVGSQNYNVNISVDCDLLVGDQIYVSLHCYAIGTSGILNIHSGGSFSNKVNNVGLKEGDTISMSQAVPLKIKQKDFINSIIRMFNLYIETDKLYTKKLYIEPRDNFYANGVTRDWTNKLDTSQDLKIVPMGELNNNKFIYTYKEDSDYYNELYKKLYDDTYGSKTINVNNDFLTETNTTTVIFSPTPLAGDATTDRIISKIYTTDSNGDIKPKQSNIRILYYGGVFNTNYAWTYKSTVSGDSSYTTYPYAGHLDVPTNPTIDINWGVPYEVFYSTLKYTNNNLYNSYYAKFLSEIINPDSKIVSGYFRLTPLDINLLDFRDTFYIGNVALRLNKIYDYDPVNSSLTKCEFLKIQYTNNFEPITLTSYGGIQYPFPIQQGEQQPQQ